MIDFARVSKMVEYIHAQALWAEWKNSTRCWEYPWILENGCFEKGLRCLDAGCGQSPLPAYLHGLGCESHGLNYIHNKIGVYPETYGVSQELMDNWKGKVAYHQTILPEAPFDANTFDRITCVSVLEHILTPRRPHAHYPCLNELKRILKPGGLLIVTVDYFINADVTPGYDYRDDITFLDMPLLAPDCHSWTREEMAVDEDTFFVPPQMYIDMGYGRGFNKRVYHRLTSVGYILIKQIL